MRINASIASIVPLLVMSNAYAASPESIEAGLDRINETLGPGGKLVPVVNYESRRFTRDGSDLVIRRKMQGYQLLTRPEGETLPLPDFNRPQGRPFEEEQRSGGK